MTEDNTSNDRDEVQKAKVKMNKLTKKLVILCITLLFLFFINNLIMYFNEDYSLFFIKNIINPIRGIIFYLFSFIPYFSILLIPFLVVSILVLGSLMIYYENYCKKSVEYINKRYNVLIRVHLLIISFFLSNILLSCSDIHVANFDTLLFSDTKNKTYDKEDLIDLAYILLDKINSYDSIIKRDNGKIIYNNDYNSVVISNLRGVSNKIPLLKGLYPARSYNMSNLLKGVFGSDTIGLTHFYSTYFDYDSSSVYIINTMMHEYCHSKGIVRENEAVFCSFLAGVESDDIVSQYSSYVEAFGRVLSAIYAYDKDLSKIIEDSFVSKCYYDNYEEACDFYVKNDKEYLLGADSIYISTYLLKNYVDDKDMLFNYLKELEENGARFKLNDEVSLDDIIKNFDDYLNNNLLIRLDLDKNKFNKIKNNIFNNKFYMSIYQHNYDEDVSDVKMDLDKYYLKPFEDYDRLIEFGSVSATDYSYDRVVRLLLEYYDKG